MSTSTAMSRDDANQITYVFSNDIKEWDPAVIYSTEVRTLLNVYETLTRFDPAAGKADPLLATSWSVSDDGLTWTFKLREGVTFHDGTPFDAEAAKSSIDRTMKMGKGASYIWSGVTSIEAPDSTTLLMKTEKPMPLDLIASSQYGAFIVSPTATEKGPEWFANGNEAGTGPYRLADYSRSQQAVLEKFDDYWGGWTGDHFDRVVVRFVQEVSTQVQMLRGGEGDLMISPPPNLLDTLSQDQELKVDIFDSWLNIPLSINTQKYPTDNLKFREALTYLMDYAAIAESIFPGTGSVPKSCLPQSIAGSGQFDLPSFDPETARQLLEESGIPEKDWKVNYYAYNGREGIMEIAEMFQALAAQVGVTVDIQNGEWGVMWDKQRTLETSGNMFAMVWWADWASPTGWLTTLWRSEDPTLFNFSYYSNADFDKLLDEATGLQGTDPEAAAQKFADAQGKLHEDAVAMCLVDLKQAVVYRADVEGVEYNPAYETIFAYELHRAD
ncbi:ABC transporter substrate-binding protein [Hoeflea sp. WL0058]|uniref:ABC transporter substrate-binding protein n=2 Tax=Flavimaribacter sediminis TaxID=2865987 RepID=A0AAE3CZP1_9HYPH|nr:ABC transporter substrate-binding protein [Flavimaribacter sediminis]